MERAADCHSSPERRERLIRWHDTAPTTRAAAALDGLQVLRGQADGVYPMDAAGSLLNLAIDRVALGHVRFDYRPDASHADEVQQVHGGVLAALIDYALRATVRSALPAAVALRTEELNVHLVRDVPLGGASLVLEGALVHSGPRLLTAEARLKDSSGALCAHGSATLSAWPDDARRVNAVIQPARAEAPDRSGHP